MTEIVRPLRFDNIRRERRNAKRRAGAKRRKERELAFSRPFNRLFWFGIEPEKMWATDFDGSGANDNARC